MPFHRSRLSNAQKRARRFKLKYMVDPVVLRYKSLLPQMVPGMTYALYSWDELELLLFARYAVLGIPTALQPFYTAWAKQKASIGLRFGWKTFEAETDVLHTVFEKRGLDPDTLDDLEDTVDVWLAQELGDHGAVVDGGFEKGVLDAWDNIGGEIYHNDVIGSYVHRGAYSCKLGYSCLIGQVLVDPVAVDDIGICKLFLLAIHNTSSEPYLVQVQVKYDDLTEVHWDESCSYGVWLYVDIRPHLTSGKNVKSIYVHNYKDEYDDIYLDDVTLLV
jgi:hypothetical protein